MSPLVESDNLSYAWAQTFLRIIDNPGSEFGPLLLTISDFSNGQIKEDFNIRYAVDAALRAAGKKDVETTAFTIFPEPVWRLAKGDRHHFYKMYLDALPRYASVDPNGIRQGTYFARLVAYWTNPMTGEQMPHLTSGAIAADGNQIEHIISSYLRRSAVRRSMLQASVFDPARDHVLGAQLGFPCMQQISFTPCANGTLSVNVFYATQQLFARGYGNYLGLCRLGRFVAQEMGLRLSSMYCFVGIEKMAEQKSSATLKPLIAVAREALVNAGYGDSSWL